MRNTSDNLIHRMLIIASLLAVLIPAGQVFGQATEIVRKMKRYDGKYHTIYSDLSDEQTHDVIIRMEAVVDEYMRRARDYAKPLNAKLPFLIFRNQSDYLKAGGMQGTAGVYTGSELLAIAGDQIDEATWHTLQHEGYHQFAETAIGSNLPIWLNEGLAEYFGEAIYTGDGFVSGAIPYYRLKRVRSEIDGKAFKPLETMMNFSHEEWNSQMSASNYDQAWSMVMYLAHGENGKYQKQFDQYIHLTGQGEQSDSAWKKTFGSTKGFETAWKQWWQSKDRDDQVEPYVQANVQMLTSYLARSVISKNKIETIDDLIDAIQNNKIQQVKNEQLPFGLNKDCIELYDGLKAKRKCNFSIKPAQNPQFKSVKQFDIVCEMPDGTIVSGSYKLKNGNRIDSVSAKIVKPKK